MRVAIDAIKKAEDCQICGWSGGLTFHHRRKSEKRRTIAGMISRRNCDEAILREMEKCDVLCFKCHCTVHMWFQIVDTFRDKGIRRALRTLGYAILNYREWIS